MWEAIGGLTGSRWKVTSTFRLWQQEGKPEWAGATGEEREYVWFSAERVDKPGEHEANEGKMEERVVMDLGDEELTGKEEVVMDLGDEEVGGADEEEGSMEDEEEGDEAEDHDVGNGHEADDEASNTHEQQTEEEDDLIFFD
ncbi:MAG: hypothetical protein Q9194_004986 [Teloschistes cf. exilis]